MSVAGVMGLVPAREIPLAFVVSATILIVGLAGRLSHSDAAGPSGTIPEIQCIVAAKDGSFEIHVNRLGHLEDVAFAHGGIDVAEIPERSISIDHPAIGFFVSAAILKLGNVHLDRKRTYDVRVEASGAAYTAPYDPSVAGPQGTGC